MTLAKVKRSFPHLRVYVEKKTRRKFRENPKLEFHRKGRVGSGYHLRNGKQVVSVSRRVAQSNPVLAKGIIVHELGELLSRSHRKARQLERGYLKAKRTSYRREAMKYRRS